MSVITGKNLNIPTRRYLAATIIPLALFYSSILLLINNINTQYEFTQKEIKGVSVISQLHNSIIGLQKIRGLSGITLDDTDDIIDEVKTLQYEFNDSLNRITFDDNFQNIVFSGELHSVKNRIDNLFRANSLNTSSDDLFLEYTNSIARLKQIIKIAADRSNLTLDPELESYYMMSLITVQFPEIIELLGRVRGKGSSLIAGTNKRDEETGRLLGHLAVLKVGLENMKNTTKIVYAASPELEKRLQKMIIKAEEKANLFISYTNEAIYGTSRLSPLEYFNKGTEAITAYLAPHREIGRMLTGHLLERADRLRLLRNLSFTGTLIAAILIIYFAFSFYKYNKAIFNKIQHMSITDMLTGLYNRRYMHMIINKEINRVHREKKSFSLAILDVDYFKPFNDNHGHLEGDTALIEVAAALKENLKRAGDFLFRIGGEEFCFFFSGESSKATLAIADEIRASIEKLEIRHRKSAISSFLTISIGIAHSNALSKETYSLLMQKADEALYKAKLKGRNRCEIIHL
ncbi:MAG: GGDEF domain-containing protein [Deltaproteobacteria bacterium]|nr:GGDEF domain-containing protein [Deltaproteobacteria bacterium]